MKRRSFLAAVAALPVFGVFKTTKPTPEWKKGPIDVLFVGEYPNGRWMKDPFIEVNLDNGPVTIGDLTFSTSYLEPVRLSTGYGPIPKEAINLTPNRETIEKLRDLVKSNGGTLDLVWGPDIFYNWVRIDCRGSKHSNLIPLSRENQSMSELFDSQNKQYGSLPKKFYHIKYKNTSNLWVQVGLVDLRSNHET